MMEVILADTGRRTRSFRKGSPAKSRTPARISAWRVAKPCVGTSRSSRCELELGVEYSDGQRSQGWCRTCQPDTCVCCHEALNEDEGVETCHTASLREFVNRQRDERIAANFEDRYIEEEVVLLCRDCYSY